MGDHYDLLKLNHRYSLYYFSLFENFKKLKTERKPVLNYDTKLWWPLHWKDRRARQCRHLGSPSRTAIKLYSPLMTKVPASLTCLQLHKSKVQNDDAKKFLFPILVSFVFKLLNKSRSLKFLNLFRCSMVFCKELGLYEVRLTKV